MECRHGSTLVVRRCKVTLGLATGAKTITGETMSSEERGLTIEELRERIRAARVTIAENRLSMVRRLLGDALAPVRALDSRAVRTLEPAVTFAPTRVVTAPPSPEGHDG
jgi:hypothetical protein